MGKEKADEIKKVLDFNITKARQAEQVLFSDK